MPKFLIEREIPGAGNLSGEELQAIAQTSCGVLQKMGYHAGYRLDTIWKVIGKWEG